MKIIKLSLQLALAFLCTAVNAQVIEVPNSGNSPTKTMLIHTEHPKALVILLIGGNGKVGLFDNGSARSNHTFVRSQSLWAQYGVDAVLVDSTDDLAIKGGGRITDDYQNRLLSVVTYYKNKFDVPVWLFGHSNGTVSVTEFVNRLGESGIISGFIVAGTERTAVLRDH